MWLWIRKPMLLGIHNHMDLRHQRRQKPSIKQNMSQTQREGV